MSLARWQATIVDEAGDIVPNAFIEVRRDIAGTPLASIYSDREGATPIANPFQADAEGFAGFHVSGGPYRIRAYQNGFQRIWRYVGIGTNAEADYGTLFLPRGAWSAVITYGLGEMVSHVSGGEPYAFISNHASNLNNAPPFSGGVGTSDSHWTVAGLIESPGEPGPPGSANVVGTSVTSLAIGTGSKVFTVVESDRGWGVGARVHISSDANPTIDWMDGVVTAYADPTLTVSVDLTSGSGTHADWTINLSGQPGSATGGASQKDFIYQTVGGTANAITASEFTSGTLHHFKAGAANTGAATFNGKAIKFPDGTALTADALQPGIWYTLMDDGTNYTLIQSGAVL